MFKVIIIIFAIITIFLNLVITREKIKGVNSLNEMAKGEIRKEVAKCIGGICLVVIAVIVLLRNH